MRKTPFAWSSVGLMLLTSACTIENASKSVAAETGGSSTGGTALGGAHTAGANAVTGGANNTVTSFAGAATGIAGSSAVGSNLGTAGASGGSASGGSASGGSASGGTSDSTSNGGVAGGTTTAGATSLRGGAAGSGASLGGAVSVGGVNAFGGAAAAGTANVAGSGPAPKSLPPTTFVFERKVASGLDHLVAMDLVSRGQRVITTLAEGSVAGWNIDGVTVSPDRTRIVIASLYGATLADNATGLATNRLWSLDIEGKDFRRLTPVFPNQHAGQTGWRIDVRDPAYSADGQYIVFDYGEGDSQGGYVAPWVLAADGSSLPSLIQTNLDCSVNGNAAFNPVTGDLLLEHAVCIGSQKGGYFLYPNAGGGPDFLVNDTGISISGEPPAFSADGSLFVFTARAYSDNVQSLYAYIMRDRTVVPLIAGSPGTDIVNASFSPDDRYMVYCIRTDNAYDLRVVDFGLDPPVDSALTSDGISCDAVF